MVWRGSIRFTPGENFFCLLQFVTNFLKSVGRANPINGTYFLNIILGIEKHLFLVIFRKFFQKKNHSLNPTPPPRPHQAPSNTCQHSSLCLVVRSIAMEPLCAAIQVTLAYQTF